jgi:hypothetical protein
MVHGVATNDPEGHEKSELYSATVCYVGAERKIQELFDDLDGM